MKKIVIGLWISVFFFHGCKSNHDNIAMYVNHEPITVSEMEYWMSLSKAEVYSYFFKQYEVAYTPDFWMDSFEGKSPMAMLKNVTIDRLVKSKVQQLLARDMGIIENIGFDAIMAEKRLENQARKISMVRGEPIYGPVQFNAITFFDHVFDKMVYDAKQHLLTNYLSKDTLCAKKNFKFKNDKFEEKSGFHQMEYIDKKYELLVLEMVRVTDLIINKDVFNKLTVN